jgi:hypothetical protein
MRSEQMDKPIIYFFVKTFENTSYASQFLDGLLYMNTLDYFVQLETNDSTGRGDRHEGLNAWLQPKDIEIEINGIQISSADLASPVSIRSNQQLSKNIFCLHAGYVGGKARSKFNTPQEFENQLKIPDENISLGMQSIVITNVEEFILRVKKAAAFMNESLDGRIVNYYDPNTSRNVISEEDAPFNKQMNFEHQREYRIVINRTNQEMTAYRLNVGCLRDIAHEISIKELNEGIKIAPIEHVKVTP